MRVPDVFGATVLAFDQLNEPGVAFVLHAIIQDQKGIWPIGDERADQFPQAVLVKRSLRR